MKIYLTRHGESQWNIEGRLQGSFDSQLTEKGKKDSQKLHQYLEQQDIRLDNIYTSTSTRAIETTSIIASSRKLSPILTEKIKEMDTGDWQGQTWSEIKRHDPNEYHNYWYSPHLYQAQNGGEDFYRVQERSVSFIKELITGNSEKNLLVVSHGVVLNSILNYYQKQPIQNFWDQSLILGASLSLLEVKEDQVQVVFRGVDDYLIN